MATVIVKSRVGADGVLQVDVPLDAAFAGKEVEIAVTPVPEPVSEEERRAIMDSLGTWQGEFDIREDPYFTYALSHLRPSDERVERPRTQEAWAAWVRKISGCVTDPTFVRPEQGEHEVRDSLE